MTIARHALTAATLAALAVATVPASAETVPYEIPHNEPDHDSLHVTGSLYYGIIGSNFVNVGAHAQATYSVAPALELQGTGMLNVPGISDTSFLRAEGSAFLAIPWLGARRLTLSSTVHGSTITEEYIEVPRTLRKKFGIEGGLFYDRHGVKLVDGNDTLSPVTSVGAFVGLKYVVQGKSTIEADGGRWRQHGRNAFYLHVMRAFSQSFDQPPGVTPTTQVEGAPLGLRLGMESKWDGDIGFFVKFEGGYMPSARGVDGFMMLYLGASHGRALF